MYTLRSLSSYVPGVFQVIKKFRDEELEHLETGLEHDAEKVPWQFHQIKLNSSKQLYLKLLNMGICLMYFFVL